MRCSNHISSFKTPSSAVRMSFLELMTRFAIERILDGFELPFEIFKAIISKITVFVERKVLFRRFWFDKSRQNELSN